MRGSQLNIRQPTHKNIKTCKEVIASLALEGITFDDVTLAVFADFSMGKITKEEAIEILQDYSQELGVDEDTKAWLEMLKA